MKPGKGVERLLLLAEVVLLMVVISLGAARKLATPKTQNVSQSESTENMDIQPEPENVTGETIEEEETAEEEEMLASMTLEEKVAQMFLTSPESLTQMYQVTIAGDRTRAAVGEYPVGGVIYSRHNYEDRAQVTDLLVNAEKINKELTDLYLFLAVRMDSEEGESVVGISEEFESGAIVEAIETEHLGSDSEGIIFPVVYPMQQSDIAEDTAWIMLKAMIDVEASGEENLPCALSEKCVETIREAGCEGLILTDSLSADSIANRYSVGEAAVLAVQAGVDMIYCPDNFPDAYQAVLDAVRSGEIEEAQINQAVGHIIGQKFQIPEPDETVDTNTNRNNAGTNQT